MLEQVHVYIIEDDVAYGTKLQESIQSFSSFSEFFSLKIHIIEELDSFFTQLNTLTIHDNDIFLIDIDLQLSFSGIEIATKIREQNNDSFILFLTNLEDRGIEILNQQINAKSYIIKGIATDPRILENLFEGIKKEIIKRTQDNDEYIALKKYGEIVYIRYTDILYIKSITTLRNTLLVKTVNSELVVEGSINKLKKGIHSPYLYLELKSSIINVSHVVSVSRTDGIVTFDTGSEMEVGRRVIDKLERVL